MSDFEKLDLRIEGTIARIWLDQPDARNAFDDIVIAELHKPSPKPAPRRRSRPSCSAPTARPLFFFCAGANLNWMRRMADYTRGENIADAGKLAAMPRTIAECPKPTIARVQGDVYAGGMGLVAACDMAVSVDTAWYCLSEVKIGLVPATISPYVLRAMGTRALAALLPHGRAFHRRRGPPRRLRA